MKKIALVLALGLLIQSFPTNSMASSGPPPPPAPTILGAAALITVAFFGLGIFGGAASTKATGTEFEKLNNNPAFPTLLNQMAGGSLNTVEILN